MTANLLLQFTIDGDGMIEPAYPALGFPYTMSIGSIKAHIRKTYNVPAQATLYISAEGQEYSDDVILENTGLRQNDQIRCIVSNPNVMNQFGANRVAEMPQSVKQLVNADPQAVIAEFIANPSEMQMLLNNQPILAEAILNHDVVVVKQWQNETRKKWEDKIFKERTRVMNINANPLDSNAQAQILEEIRLANVDQNRMLAMEHMPEAFTRVPMLYVPIEINGVIIPAFVDSGAQSTIISKNLAIKTDIFRLIDRRYAGVAKGVGTARILGRVHLTEIKFGNMRLPCSFTVMDDNMEFLFGLDMLKRHQGCIDLEKNVLRLRGEAVRFLSEGEIPQIRAQNRIDAGLSPSTPVPKKESKEDTEKAVITAEAISQLLFVGFDQKNAEDALNLCNGDVNLAAGMLYSKSWVEG